MSDLGSQVDEALNRINYRNRRAEREYQAKLAAYQARWQCDGCKQETRLPGMPPSSVEPPEQGTGKYRAEEGYEGIDHYEIMRPLWHLPPKGFRKCSKCKRFMCQRHSSGCGWCRRDFCVDHLVQGYCERDVSKIIKESNRPWWWPSWLWF
jgi:hypothetical protein